MARQAVSVVSKTARVGDLEVHYLEVGNGTLTSASWGDWLPRLFAPETC